MATTEMNCLASGGGVSKLLAISKIASDSATQLTDVSIGNILIIPRSVNVSRNITNVDVLVAGSTSYYPDFYVDILKVTGVPVATSMGGTCYMVFDDLDVSALT